MSLFSRHSVHRKPVSTTIPPVTGGGDGAGGTPDPPPPTPTPVGAGFGMAAAPGDFFAKNSTQIDAILTDHTYLGLKWARIAIDWPNVQTTRGGAYNWSQYDTLLARLAAKNFRAIILCSGSTPWSRNPTTVPPAGWEAVVPPTQDMDGFAAFCAQVAVRYGNQNPVLEIWNEPNIEAFWRPHPDALSYTQLLAKSYNAVKAVRPGITVISAGLTLGFNNGFTVHAVDYLNAMYNNGAAGKFDGLGWHPYGWHNTGAPAYVPGGVDASQPWYQMYGTTPSARSLMTARGDGAKKIWVTEFGVHTSVVDQVSGTDAEQANIYKTAVQLWATYPWAGAFNFYTYQDSAPYGASGENEKYFGFWLVNHTQGSPTTARKPAVEATKAAIAATGL